ncbi:MAG TPA: efflux RND transporter periplasmic adaptor subunit [Burkholderiales bacterium]|nr:efflux RND transporter periplasmic adaptor subunit [Burkholderiales bacterium]
MRFLFPFLIAVVIAGCGPSGGAGKDGKGGPMGGMPPAQVAVITVEARSLPASYEYTGQTIGSREVEVRARVTGILQERNFKEGGPVKKGQSLFTIDPAPFIAAAVRAEADVSGAEARLAQAKKNASRLKPLFAEKAVSQKEYDDSTSAEAIADADLKSAKARLTEARLNLLYTKVESPVSGIAGRAQRSDGSLVSGPDVLLTTVTQVDPIWVSFGVPDNEQLRINGEVAAGRLELPKGGNFEVSIKLADGSAYPQTGKLNFSDVRVSGATGTSETRAELPNPKGVLRPGQFVRVTLKGATRPNAITVPQRAVLEGPQGKFVYVTADGKAEARPVQVAEWTGSDWIIASGLKAGEQVIVDGVMKIGPGAPVQVAEPKKEQEKTK